MPNVVKVGRVRQKSQKDQWDNGRIHDVQPGFEAVHREDKEAEEKSLQLSLVVWLHLKVMGKTWGLYCYFLE